MTARPPALVPHAPEGQVAFQVAQGGGRQRARVDFFDVPFPRDFLRDQARYRGLAGPALPGEEVGAAGQAAALGELLDACDDALLSDDVLPGRGPVALDQGRLAE
jgi:hypothetical protein